jgi:hypothetical protein
MARLRLPTIGAPKNKAFADSVHVARLNYPPFYSGEFL